MKQQTDLWVKEVKELLKGKGLLGLWIVLQSLFLATKNIKKSLSGIQRPQDTLWSWHRSSKMTVFLLVLPTSVLILPFLCSPLWTAPRIISHLPSTSPVFPLYQNAMMNFPSTALYTYFSLRILQLLFQ